MKRLFETLIILLIFFPVLVYSQKKENEVKKELKARLITIASTGDSLNSSIDRTFGRAEKFIIYNLNDDTFTVIDNEYAHSPSSAGTQTAWEMVERKVEAVITQGCGQKSLNILSSSNIKVFRNVKGTVKDAIEDFKKGKLNRKN